MKLAAAFCVTWVLVQVAIPVMQLPGPRPARFGWQMYSTLPLGARGEVFRVERASGALERVRISDHVVRSRSDVDYLRLLPPRLCEVVPGAVAVVVEREGDLLVRHECP